MKIRYQQKYTNTSRKRLHQFIIGFFGTCGLYILFGIIYQKIIMSSYQNIYTKEKQYFKSSAGYIFLKHTFIWIITEIFSSVFCKNYYTISMENKQTIFNIFKNKNILICSFLVFFSGVLFTEGIYYTSYRLSLAIKTSIFFASSILGFFFSPLKNKINNPKIKDIFLGAGILGGMILFWVYDNEICFYIPVKPGVISVLIIVASVLCQSLLSIFQAQYKQKNSPSPLLMMINVIRGTFLFSFIYIVLKGQTFQTFSFTVSHPQFTLDIIFMCLISFLGQLFIYRMVIRMQMNVPAFVISTRKVLSIQLSYLFTVNPYIKEQIIGVILSVLCILIQIYYIIKNNQDENIQIQQKKATYSTVDEIPLEQN